MKSVIINATEREDLGSKFARKLRKEGNVPCVVYGGEKPVHFYAPVLNYRDLVYTNVAKKAVIEVGGNTIEAIMQDIQFHPVTDAILHIDFMQLIPGKLITLDVPVFLSGSARGVLNGGRLKHTLRKLSVRALPKDLPDSIEIDITALRIGQSIRVAEVATDNFEILNLQKAVVCSIGQARGAMEDEEETEETEEGAEGAEGTEGEGDSSES
jgi:large subunit ribosomal protein L25